MIKKIKYTDLSRCYDISTTTLYNWRQAEDWRNNLVSVLNRDYYIEINRKKIEEAIKMLSDIVELLEISDKPILQQSKKYGLEAIKILKGILDSRDE